MLSTMLDGQPLGLGKGSCAANLLVNCSAARPLTAIVFHLVGALAPPASIQPMAWDNVRLVRPRSMAPAGFLCYNCHINMVLVSPCTL